MIEKYVTKIVENNCFLKNNLQYKLLFIKETREIHARNIFQFYIYQF